MAFFWGGVEALVYICMALLWVLTSFDLLIFITYLLVLLLLYLAFGARLFSFRGPPKWSSSGSFQP
jgi:cobalamin biosynthesis protein CobD/CbiB